MSPNPLPIKNKEEEDNNKKTHNLKITQKRRFKDDFLKYGTYCFDILCGKNRVFK